MSHLRQTMTHYEDLHIDPFLWNGKLLHMDFITIELQKKVENKKSKGSRKKRSLKKNIQLREGDNKKKGEFLPTQDAIKQRQRKHVWIVYEVNIKQGIAKLHWEQRHFCFLVMQMSNQYWKKGSSIKNTSKLQSLVQKPIQNINK